MTGNTTLPADKGWTPELICWLGAGAALALKPSLGERLIRRKVDVEAVLFLLGWEVMSVLSYLLIVHHRHQENGHSSAGYLLLAMGEAGTLAAALSFLVLAMNVNSVDFATLKSAASGLTGGARWAVFLFSFFGFGVKA